MVAFVCPLYDMRDHFNYARNLLHTKVKFAIAGDMVFIFSNVEQKNKFLSLIGDEATHMRWLIMPQELTHYKAQAVTKKLWGLDALNDEYEYIVLVDAESLFLRAFDPDVLCREIWQSHNPLVANRSYDGFFIMRTCYQTMGLYHHPLLRKATENYLYNFWFNEIQVYETATLKEFFVRLQQFPIEAIYNEWNCFEYYVFAAFLIIEKGWQLKKIPYKSFGGINEYLVAYPQSQKETILQALGTHWTGDQDAVNSRTVMAFHLDRKKNWHDYANDSLRSKMRCVINRQLILLKDWLKQL